MGMNMNDTNNTGGAVLVQPPPQLPNGDIAERVNYLSAPLIPRVRPYTYA